MRVPEGDGGGMGERSGALSFLRRSFGMLLVATRRGSAKVEASKGATEADIAGCYVAPLGDGSDKICILPPSRFEQEFSLSDSTPVHYYSGIMRVFSYKRDGHLAVAATLVNFTVVNERGAVVAARTIDIQPFENMFGQMMFLVGSDVAGHERLYKREN